MIPHIFFVDDEPKVCRAVSRTLGQLGVQVSSFTRAAECLEQLGVGKCNLLIADVKMPGMDGIELLTRAKRVDPSLTVLVITGYGDIPMAVRALKAGAADFIEKPLNRKPFLSLVERLLKRATPPEPLLGRPLSRAETKVFRLLLDGKTNKEIAYLLHRSIRTVEVHRRNVMRKFGVDNLVDLVKRAAELGLLDLPESE